MRFRQWLKEVYYLRIKGWSRHQMLLDHLRRTGMEIGSNCCIFSDCIETAEPFLVKIGDGCMISVDVRFSTHDAAIGMFVDEASDIFGRIEIGNHCFLGMRSTILPGVTIADNCIVGAGSVVTKSFLEPGSVIAGVPAKKIGTVQDYIEKNSKHFLCTYGMDYAQKKKYLSEHSDKLKKA